MLSTTSSSTTGAPNLSELPQHIPKDNRAL